MNIANPLVRIFSLFLLFFIVSTAGHTANRWRFVGDNMWDTESAVKVSADKIRFWYEYPFMEEQRASLVKSGVYSRAEASSIFYGRSGVIADCSARRYAFFSVSELNKDKNPISAGVQVKPNELNWVYVEPATNMEDILKDVCKFFRLK